MEGFNLNDHRLPPEMVSGLIASVRSGNDSGASTWAHAIGVEVAKVGEANPGEGPILQAAAEAVATVREVDAQIVEADQCGGLRVESLPDNWADTAPPPREVIFFYPRGKASALLAAGTVGKTTLIAEQAAHLAAGVDWRGFPVRQGDVAIVSWEDEVADYAGKLFAAVRSNPALRDHLDEIKRRVHFVSLHGTGKHLVRAQAGKPVVTELPGELVRLLGKFPDLAWVIFETASRANASDEMNEGMARLVDALEIVAQRLNVASTVSHHVSKAAIRSAEIDATAGRGGSALADNCRSTTVMVTVDEDSPASILPPGHTAADMKGRDVVLIDNARASYARKAPRLWLERRFLPEGLPYFAPLERPTAAAGNGRDDALDRVDTGFLAFLCKRMGEGWHSERTITRDWHDEHGIGERTARGSLSRLVLHGKVVKEARKQHGDTGKKVTMYRLKVEA